MTDYRPGLPAARVHAALLRALSDLRSAERCAVLWFGEIARRRLYRDLGHATIHLYAERALGFSRSKTYQFLRLAEDLERLPALKAAVTDGSVSWTKARAVAGVADETTDAAWVGRARTSTVRRLREDVARAKSRPRSTPAQPLLIPDGSPPPATSPPVHVTLRFRATDAARFEGLLEILWKRGLTGSREELLLTALDRLDAQKSTRVHSENRYQILIAKCPDCGVASIAGTEGARSVAGPELAAAECDARVVTPDGRGRAAVPPSVRRAVLMRDGYRCRTKGCRNRRFLEVHHVVPRSAGGGHDLENLVTLCGACHRQAHRARTPHSPASEETGSRRGCSPPPSRT